MHIVSSLTNIIHIIRNVHSIFERIKNITYHLHYKFLYECSSNEVSVRNDSNDSKEYRTCVLSEDASDLKIRY